MGTSDGGRCCQGSLLDYQQVLQLKPDMKDASDAVRGGNLVKLSKTRSAAIELSKHSCEQAIPGLNEVTEVASHDTQCWYLLAQCLYGRKQYQEVLVAAGSLLKADGNNIVR